MAERQTGRWGLYVMVFLILLNSCDSIDAIKRIERQQKPVPCVQAEVKP